MKQLAIILSCVSFYLFSSGRSWVVSGDRSHRTFPPTSSSLGQMCTHTHIQLIGGARVSSPTCSCTAGRIYIHVHMPVVSVTNILCVCFCHYAHSHNVSSCTTRWVHSHSPKILGIYPVIVHCLIGCVCCVTDIQMGP